MKFIVSESVPMHLPDFEAMAILAKIVECGTFVAAARELGLSKATISKAVRRLEERVGAPVFLRTTRRLSLTDTGRSLAARAAEILAQAQEAEEAAMQQASSPRGDIRLTVPMSYGVHRVAPLIAQFLQRYPDIHIDLDLNDARIDMIAEGFDAALRIADMPDSSLIVRRICPVEQYLLAAPGLIEKYGQLTHPMQLSSLPCLSYAYAARRNVWSFWNDSGEDLSVQPSGPLRVNNGEAMVAALLAGVGFGILPNFLVDSAIARGALVRILPAWHMSRSSLYWVTPSGTHSPLRVRLLGDFLVSRLKGNAADVL